MWLKNIIHIVLSVVLSLKEKDYSKAFYYTKRAAEMFCPQAMFNLGSFYLHGIGVAKNEQEARKWFLKAEELGIDVLGKLSGHPK